MEEREIFLEAIEITDSESQKVFLENACQGNPALLDRLHHLLKMHIGAGSFLKTPAIAQINLANSVAPPNKEPSDGLSTNVSKSETSPRAGDLLPEISLGFLQPSTRSDSLGRLGRFEVLQVLGSGAFGIVLKAFDDKLQRIVAIKVISSSLFAASSTRQRFLREARAFAAVRDSNTVQIYEIEEQPIPYLVMEYVPSKTIQQKIDENGPMSVAMTLKIGQQIAGGLAAAHAVGLIHRDIKPANILLEEGGAEKVKITDFGLARALDADHLTQTEVIAGTPMFMSPEQAVGETFDQRADLFSLGSVLYVMLCGRSPFQATTTSGLLKRVAEDIPVPIQKIAPDVPAWLCQIIEKLHAKKPDDRFGSAKEVAELLNRCQIAFDRGEVPEMGDLEPLKTSAATDIRRGRWLVVGLAAALVLAGLIVSLWKKVVPQIAIDSSGKVNTPSEPQSDLEPSIELGPLIKPGNMGDGLFTDISFGDRVIRLDSTSGSRQTWINFPHVRGEEVTIETEFRVTKPTDFGMGKLIFVPDQGHQIAAVIVFGMTGYQVYIESSDAEFPEEDKILFRGTGALDWSDLKFVVALEKYSLIHKGKLMLERPRETRHPGYVAIACLSSVCEMKVLRVTLKNGAASSANR